MSSERQFRYVIHLHVRGGVRDNVNISRLFAMAYENLFDLAKKTHTMRAAGIVPSQ